MSAARRAERPSRASLRTLPFIVGLALSSNPAVATITKGPGSQIQVIAVGAGSATITVRVGQMQKTCAVTVMR